MPEILIAKATDSIDGDEYVMTGIARLRSGQEVGRAELRVPLIAVDASVVGKAEVEHLKSALEAAVQAIARAKARAGGH
ncbi:hypothetical protein [Sorangium atrum]|uniref:Uncharacterized protein n=1 Tax=Sorangium atrum TaxID=2995308 RepID=A0ABT5BZV0_9BACT|nr:hypothetical protein [Sorangium aterium]MDC0679696.1 hypothetical protein [Sorangium aterium]